MSGAEDGIVETARTLLFVPGDRSDRFDKAVASGADLVVLDLEDAVAAQGKASAREHVVRWLARGRAVVRVNAVGTPWHDDDLAALTGLPGLVAVMVPKAEHAAELDAVSSQLDDVPVVALVESALGVHQAFSMGSARSVARLAFGSLDYALDIGVTGSTQALAFARSTIVNASRAAGLVPPVDGVTVDVRDDRRLRRDLDLAVSLGFGGRLCIHPSQVTATARAFAPAAAEVEWATKVLTASAGGGVVTVDGEMVDEPVRRRAGRILRSAAGPDGRPGESLTRSSTEEHGDARFR